MDSVTMKKRLETTKEALKALLGFHPMTLQPAGFWRGKVPNSWGYATLTKLQDAGLIKRMSGGAIVAVPDMINAALTDERILLTMLWPGAYAPAAKEAPSYTLEDGDLRASQDGAEEETAVVLQPPPALEGVQKPPPGAPPEVVQEWIFTLLHAQTQNLIYIRETVDRLLEAWEGPKK